MVLDAKRYHIHQLDIASCDSPPSAPWIDTFVMQMSRLGTRLPPAAVVARATQLWHTHWCDDPVQTALSELHTRARLAIDVEGATAEELARGLAAAAAVLDAGGASPQRALRAHWLRQGWEEQGSPNDMCPSAGDLRVAALWDDAEVAAALACCQGWTRRPPERATLSIEEAGV
jgi:hypothetical protein